MIKHRLLIKERLLTADQRTGSSLSIVHIWSVFARVSYPGQEAKVEIFVFRGDTIPGTMS